MDQLKMYSLLNMRIFHCYVSLLEGSCIPAFILFPGKDARIRPVKSNCSGLRWLISRESTGLHKIRVGDVSWFSRICGFRDLYARMFLTSFFLWSLAPVWNFRRIFGTKRCKESILPKNEHSFNFGTKYVFIQVLHGGGFNHCACVTHTVWSNFTNISGWNFQMDVSENNGIPKSSILIGFSIINHPFWGTPIFGNTQIVLILPKPPCSLLRLESFSGFREQEQRNMEACSDD